MVAGPFPLFSDPFPDPGQSFPLHIVSGIPVRSPAMPGDKLSGLDESSHVFFLGFSPFSPRSHLLLCPQSPYGEVCTLHPFCQPLSPGVARLSIRFLLFLKRLLFPLLDYRAGSYFPFCLSPLPPPPFFVDLSKRRPLCRQSALFHLADSSFASRQVVFFAMPPCRL